MLRQRLSKATHASTASGATNPLKQTFTLHTSKSGWRAGPWWCRGEEERASLLWRGLPNHLLLYILKLRTGVIVCAVSSELCAQRVSRQLEF